MAESDALLDDPLSKREIQAFYGAAAPVYDGATVEFEAKAKGVALDAMARKPGETYLEVAVGTGNSVVQQVQQTGPEGIVGIDLTPGMLSLTRERLAAAGAASLPLMLADARFLPFPDDSFDCLFNSYMLDLIPTSEIDQIVSEFSRVLKPTGRCRPVHAQPFLQTAGFTSVRRTYCGGDGNWPTEVVTAEAPSPNQ